MSGRIFEQREQTRETKRRERAQSSNDHDLVPSACGRVRKSAGKAVDVVVPALLRAVELQNVELDAAACLIAGRARATDGAFASFADEALC